MVQVRRATSGPGAMSRRTDMAPQGSEGQPTRLPTGQPYGERKQLRAQQNAAPMQSDDPEAVPGAPVGIQGGAFGKTSRPGEPITAGVAQGPGRTPRMGPSYAEQDPDMFLRAIYSRYPHPDIERMLMRRQRGR